MCNNKYTSAKFKPRPLQYNKMAALSDEARIRELAEVIRAKCAQAQQIRQQPPGVTAVIPVSSTNMLQVCVSNTK